jgi:hypothetical protein
LVSSDAGQPVAELLLELLDELELPSWQLRMRWTSRPAAS